MIERITADLHRLTQDCPPKQADEILEFDHLVKGGYLDLEEEVLFIRTIEQELAHDGLACIMLCRYTDVAKQARRAAHLKDADAIGSVSVHVLVDRTLITSYGVTRMQEAYLSQVLSPAQPAPSVRLLTEADTQMQRDLNIAFRKWGMSEFSRYGPQGLIYPRADHFYQTAKTLSALDKS